MRPTRVLQHSQYPCSQSLVNDGRSWLQQTHLYDEETHVTSTHKASQMSSGGISPTAGGFPARERMHGLSGAAMTPEPSAAIGIRANRSEPLTRKISNSVQHPSAMDHVMFDTFEYVYVAYNGSGSYYFVFIGENMALCLGLNVSFFTGVFFSPLPAALTHMKDNCGCAVRL